MSETPTPRTEDAWKGIKFEHLTQPEALAVLQRPFEESQRLERELAALRQRIAEYEMEETLHRSMGGAEAALEEANRDNLQLLEQLAAVTKERDELKAKNGNRPCLLGEKTDEEKNEWFGYSPGDGGGSTWHKGNTNFTAESATMWTRTRRPLPPPTAPESPAGYHMASEEERRCLPAGSLVWWKEGWLESSRKGREALDGEFYVCPDAPAEEPSIQVRSDEERFDAFMRKCAADYKELTGKEYPLGKIKPTSP